MRADGRLGAEGRDADGRLPEGLDGRDAEGRSRTGAEGRDTERRLGTGVERGEVEGRLGPGAPALLPSLRGPLDGAADEPLGREGRAERPDVGALRVEGRAPGRAVLPPRRRSEGRAARAGASEPREGARTEPPSGARPWPREGARTAPRLGAREGARTAPPRGDADGAGEAAPEGRRCAVRPVAARGFSLYPPFVTLPPFQRGERRTTTGALRPPVA